MSDNPHSKGFTLIELIVVLIIIGVLAISLVPRFFTASGTSEYLYRDQLLSLLRLAQMQAMQCTNCTLQPVNITAGEARIGSAVCSSIDPMQAVCVASGDAVSFSPAGSISFDAMGRPTCSAGSCTVQVQGESTLQLCIETEGYIHPC